MARGPGASLSPGPGPPGPDTTEPGGLGGGGLSRYFAQHFVGIRRLSLSSVPPRVAPLLRRPARHAGRRVRPRNRALEQPSQSSPAAPTTTAGAESPTTVPAGRHPAGARLAKGGRRGAGPCRQLLDVGIEAVYDWVPNGNPDALARSDRLMRCLTGVIRPPGTPRLNAAGGTRQNRRPGFDSSQSMASPPAARPRPAGSDTARGHDAPAPCGGVEPTSSPGTTAAHLGLRLCLDALRERVEREKAASGPDGTGHPRPVDQGAGSS
jgi:hypothetical protein